MELRGGKDLLKFVRPEKSKRIHRMTEIRKIETNMTDDCKDNTSSRCVFRKKSERIQVQL